MRVLYIEYALWKSIVQNHRLDVFAHEVRTDVYQVWAGGNELIYRTDVKDADYTDYNDEFTHTLVADEDEAIARIVGLSPSIEPHTSDGRVIVLQSRYRGDVDPYFAGCDDTGALFQLNWTSPPTEAEDKNVEWSFADWVYVSKGTVRYDDAGPGDYFAFKVYAPASVVTANAGSGNCNLVATGLGFNMIVPAAGDGSHDITTPIPVPASAADGYWEWDLPDTGLGNVTASASPGKAQYNLFDAPLDLVRWIRKLPITGEGLEHLHPETKARRVLPHWKFRVDLHNESLSPLKLIWHLDCARKKTT